MWFQSQKNQTLQSNQHYLVENIGRKGKDQEIDIYLGQNGLHSK